MKVSNINPEIAKDLLRQNRVKLVENGMFRYLKDYLLRDAILTFAESDDVMANNTPQRQMSEFVDILSRKSCDHVVRAFKCLKEADLVLYKQLDFCHLGDAAIVGDTLEIQTELMQWYRLKMSKIHPLPWCEWMEQDMDHVYTNLRAVAGRKHVISRSQPGTDEDEKGDESFGLLDKAFSKADGPIVCLIEGVSGVGKSVLCRRSAFLWSKEGGKLYNREFDLVILLTANLLTGDLKPDIAKQLFSEDFRLSPEQIYRCLDENPKKCLLIIDGLDELNKMGEECVTKLVEGRILRYINIVLTGRPEASRKFVTSVTAHLELKGFTKENVKTYVFKYFYQDSCRPTAESLLRRLQEHELASLCKTPFTTLLLCGLAEDKGELPTNLDLIYQKVISLVFRKYVAKLTECTQGSFSEGQPEIQSPDGAECMVTNLLEKAAELAYVLTESRKQNCLERELPAIFGDLLKSGILNRDSTLSRMDAKPYCYFAHRSIQEYLCAWRLGTISTEELPTKMVAVLSFASVQMGSFLVDIVLRDKSTALEKIEMAWNTWNNRCLNHFVNRGQFKRDAIRAICLSFPEKVALKYLAERLFRTFKDALDLEHGVAYMVGSDPELHLAKRVIWKLHMESPYTHAYDWNLSQKDVPLVAMLQRFVYCPHPRKVEDKWLDGAWVLISSLPNKECMKDIKKLEKLSTLGIRHDITVLAVDMLHDDSLWKPLLRLRLKHDPNCRPVRVIRLRPAVRVEAKVHPETKLSRTVCLDCRLKTPAYRMYFDKFCPY